ncbi:JmjC domain-containing protein 7 [Blattella germanica]|nr:JmjC domain-containing protein 7 [Blattella germanica]
MGKKEYFTLPEERVMSISKFIDILENKVKCPGIFYLQQQNSNLTKFFPELLEDIPPDICWATEALNGHKEFILHPPTDRPWIPYKKYPLGIYQETMPVTFDIIPYQNQTSDVLKEIERSSEPPEVETEIVEENKKSVEDTVPWICIDPLNPNYEKYPLYKKTTTVRVRVEAGDALYLPSLWFHHVQQSHGCIAVNYWYDMSYDIRYAYFQMLENLVNTNINTS